MTPSYPAAAASAACYGVATVLQAIGARRAARGGFDVGLLVRLARQAPYVAGLALDLAGFVLSLVALRTLPLFLVQSVVAANVGVTALASVVMLKARLRTQEILALVCVAAGLGLLASAAKPGHADPLPRLAQWVLLATLPALAGWAVALTRRSGRAAAITLAAVAGVAFGAVGIAARGLAVDRPWWHTVTAPGLWAVVGFGVAGMVAFAAALQRGSVTAVAAVLAGTETVVPSAVGFAVLGDATRGGMGPAVAAAGFALTLAGVFLLTRYADIEGPPLDDA
ncbi:MAG: hypothetical protein QOD07_3040 [Frankiaceae bacterium]|nr:hypothetical protein [Frankiaceae bacterium]